MNKQIKLTEARADIKRLLEEIVDNVYHTKIDKNTIERIALKYELEIDYDFQIVKQNFLPKSEVKIPMPEIKSKETELD